MNHRAHDLEPFERTWLAEAGRDVGGLRECRAACPPLALLRAAHEHALPDDLRAVVADHVSDCHSCAVLQADLAAVPPETEVSAAVEARILKDVRRKQRAEAASPAPLTAWRSWRAALAATALIVLGVAAIWQWQQRGPSPATTDRAADAALATRAAQPGPPSRPIEPVAPASPDAFRLAKPEVKLTLATLAWRGTNDRGRQYLTDLAPALDAFRADRYEDAAALFARLVAKYPTAVEVPFYLGVSRLFLNDNAGAVTALEQAAGLKAEGFADDVQWYLGLARARAGDGKRARPLFGALCGSDGPHRDAACRAVAELQKPQPK